MNTITLRKENISTTGRSDEYKGTIALDKHTAGESLEALIEPLIKKYLTEGYVFQGIKIYTSHPHLIISKNKLSIDVILSKIDNIKLKNNYILLNQEISADKFLTAFTAISINFSNSSEFEKDSIDWTNLVNLGKEQIGV